MPKSRLLCSLLASACVCLLALAGCGRTPTVTVSGTVALLPGVKLADGDSGEVAFLPLNGSGKTATAPLTGTPLTFSTSNVTPGKYKLTVRLSPYKGAKGEETRAKAYAATNKAFDAKTSKLTYEVTSDPKQSITIDLEKGSVTKG